MKDIEDKVLEDLKGVLYTRREEAINEDEKLRSFALEKFSFSFSNEDTTKLAQLYNKKFSTKQRVITLMSKDKHDIERIRNGTIEKVANLAKSLGMTLDNEEQSHNDMSILEVNISKYAHVDALEHENEAEKEMSKKIPLFL